LNTSGGASYPPSLGASAPRIVKRRMKKAG
jgi:hypothetical protein